jgi:glucokinase
MDAPVIVGLDFGGTKIAAAVCETSGVRLGTRTIDALATLGAASGLRRGIDAARDLLDEVAPGRIVVAVGACTFGIPRDDRIDLAPTIPGWGELALGTELRAAFTDAQIRLATDVKAAAYAEAEWGALAGCDPGIYLNLGTGLAVAIVANGSVIAGRNGAAGEIGYNLRSVRDVGVPSAERRSLEDAVSGRSLIRDAKQIAPLLETPAEVFAAATDDPRVKRLLADFVDELSYHLVNLTIAIDPARIVVGGGMVRSWDHLRSSLRRALDRAVPFPPELVQAQFPFDAPLMGAIALSTAAARDVHAEGARA